jgi:uncharacterized protein YkwD
LAFLGPIAKLAWIGALAALALIPVADIVPAEAAVGPSLSAPADSGQAKAVDLSSLPAAAEYSTDTPTGCGFLGSEAPVLTRSLARINKALGTSLRPDPRLARLAQWIYEHLGPEPAFPSQSELELLTRHLGLPEPLPHLLMTSAHDAPRLYTVITARLAKVFNLGEYTHIGGSAERIRGGVVVIIAVSRRHLTMAPVPRSLQGPVRLPIEGRLAVGFSRPQLVQMLPDGGTRLLPLGPGPDFTAVADLGSAGRHRLEILAEGPRGPQVLVNFPVYVAVVPDDALEAAPGPRQALKPDQAQARLVELINRARAASGLDPLLFDPELSAAALGHSENMRRENFVAHLSPTTGGPEERLLRAGIITDLAAENVGRGSDPEEIHKGFMDSPGHRAAILLPRVTHVGIGVSAAKRGDMTDYIVTELFIRRIPQLGNDARALLAAEIMASRELDNLTPVREDIALSELAGEAVRSFLDEPQLSQDDVMGRLRRRLEQSPETGASAIAVLVVAGSIKEGFGRMEIDAGTWAKVRRVGFGIAQGARPGLVPNSIVMVLIFAE